MPDMERRAFPVELRAQEGSDGQRHIEGHAAVFNSISEEIFGFKEIIMPGAFAGAIGRSDIRALVNHNPNYILGRLKAGTLSAQEDQRGLAVDIIPPDTQYARDLLVSIDRGDIDQMSFMFTVKRDEWAENNGEVVRTIYEFDQIYDVSPVTFPAYTETDVSARARETCVEIRNNAATQNAVGAGGSDGDDEKKRSAERERQIRMLEI
jgi:hypothetical protein